MALIQNISKRYNIYFLELFKRLTPQACYHGSAAIEQRHEASTQSKRYEEPDEVENFRVLEIVKKKFVRKQRTNVYLKLFQQPREKRQPVDQNWGNVWPTARSFHPSTVPLPVRMGMPYKSKASPAKYGNAELMKIPNFLHLTPPVIERQCKVLKRFCTKWPTNLETEEKQDYHFPITTSRSTYIYSSPSIREPRSRIVSLKVHIDSLKLDQHSMDKLLRLVKDRFDPETRYLTITADRCPLSSQNEEYCLYLLSVLFTEAIKTEPWEHEKNDDDVCHYTWEGSPSQMSMHLLEKSIGKKFTEDDVQIYSDIVVHIHNNDESQEIVDAYKEAVIKLSNFSPSTA